ncbi:hypothetical protein [Glutamicibacter sp.]|jgi:hypothetical protein
MSIGLWLAVEPIYLFIDRLLGSINVANLVSHFCLNFVFLAAGVQIAHSIGRCDVAARIRRFSIIGLPLCVALMTALFFATDLSYSSMGLDDFRDTDTAVVLYKLSLYIYPAVVSALLVKPLVKANAGSRYRVPFYSKKLMAIGFAFGMIAPMGHLVELTNRRLDWLTDVLVYPAMLCVLAGLVLAWISALLTHRHKLQPSPRLDHQKVS